MRLKVKRMALDESQAKVCLQVCRGQMKGNAAAQTSHLVDGSLTEESITFCGGQMKGTSLHSESHELRQTYVKISPKKTEGKAKVYVKTGE